MGTNAGNKKEIISRVATLTLLFIALVFAVVYIISLSSSLGWFSSQLNSSADNMDVAVSTDTYDVLIERTSEFDTLFEGDINKYPDMPDFTDKLTSPEYGYNLTATSASQANLAYELVNEVSYYDDGIEYHYLMPGSCGTVTFYLRPQAGKPLNATVVLNTGCFKKVYGDGDLVIERVNNAFVEDLLKGHILFFRERTGTEPDNYKYNGLIDGSFVFNSAGKALCSKPGKTDCYEVTLYWEWPMVYSTLDESISATEWQLKYPPALRTYIDSHREYFFAVNQNSSDIEELDDGYNDADQSIGEHADFITLFLSFI